tara:strand:+ start:8710 stop:10038 length:1329 start_codon:yes stop_codon:yes gene_type:complete
MEYTLIAKNDFFIAKEKRVFERLITQLFGKKTIYQPKTIEEIKDIGLSLPMIKINGSSAWISKIGKQVLISITDLFANHQRYSEYLYFEDISATIKDKYQTHIDKNTVPSSDNFFNEVMTELDSLIDERTFVGEVEGLTFEDFDYLEFEQATLKKFDESDLKFKQANDEIGNLLRKQIIDDLQDKIVFLATETGSLDVASDKFKHRAKINLSILKVLICAHIKGGFTHTHINLKSSKSFKYQNSSLVGWCSEGSLHTSRSASPRHEFPLTIERLEQFNFEQLFQKLSCIASKNKKNELEQAIEKSIYWFSEAQSDSCLASSFLKLWSCLECFFSITLDEITERNARGIASLFIYGDINMQLTDISELQDYASLKSTIKKYYQLRSAVAHRAEYRKISEHVTILLSYIVCSIILSITCLAYRGYESLERIAAECERLDNSSNH